MQSQCLSMIDSYRGQGFWFVSSFHSTWTNFKPQGKSLGRQPNLPVYYKVKEGVRVGLFQMMAEDTDRSVWACALRTGLKPTAGFGYHPPKYLLCHDKGWEDHIIMAVTNETYFPAYSVNCLPSYLLSGGNINGEAEWSYRDSKGKSTAVGSWEESCCNYEVPCSLPLSSKSTFSIPPEKARSCFHKHLGFIGCIILSHGPIKV